VLRALNAIAPAPLPAADLHAVAATLGADVAFLATDYPSAIGSGRGDILVPSSREMPVADVLLVVPPFGISTVDAYGWLREGRRYATAPGASAALTVPTHHPWAMQDQGNTFESVVDERYPVIADIRERLRAAGATIARMSGSGSTVFGLFDGRSLPPRELDVDALVIPTRTVTKVVPVEVLE